MWVKIDVQFHYSLENKNLLINIIIRVCVLAYDYIILFLAYMRCCNQIVSLNFLTVASVAKAKINLEMSITTHYFHFN